eukprot:1789425-Rhodomonas_salina.1
MRMSRFGTLGRPRFRSDEGARCCRRLAGLLAYLLVLHDLRKRKRTTPPLLPGPLDRQRVRLPKAPEDSGGEPRDRTVHRSKPRQLVP